jgi:hypothetical protein
MLLNAKRVDVWAADLVDQPGSVAEKLKGLAKAGADLQFVIARRKHDKPGTGVIYVTPLETDGQTTAAREAGFDRASGLHSVRVEGPDEPGVGYQLADAMANAGINLRGISAARIGTRCVFYLAFDSDTDADQAVQIVNRL